MTTKLRAKKNIYFFVLSFLFVLFSFGIVSAIVTERSYGVGMPLATGLVNGTNTTWFGQTFTVGATSPNLQTEVISVELQLKRVGNPSGFIIVMLSGVNPDGSPNFDSFDYSTILASEISTSYSNYTFNFNFNSKLNPSTRYSIIMTSPEGTSSNYITAMMGNGYPNNAGVGWQGDGNYWSPFISVSPVYDFYFVIEGTQIFTPQPFGVSSFPDVYLINNTYTMLNVSNYASGFDFVTLEWTDLHFGIKYFVSKQITNTTQSCYAYMGTVTACLNGTGTDVRLKFWSSVGHKGTENFRIGIYNSTSYAQAYDNFNVIASDYVSGTPYTGQFYNATGWDTGENPYGVDASGKPNVAPSNFDVDTGVLGSGVLGDVANSVSKIFPESSTLSFKSKLTYVFITLLILDIILFLIIFFVLKAPQICAWILLIFDVVLFFYFLAIGYIPVSILVVLILILITIMFFKVKGGN